MWLSENEGEERTGIHYRHLFKIWGGGQEKKKKGEDQQQSQAQQPRPDRKTRGVPKPQAVRSWRIRWALISVASFWTCQFNYDVSQLTAMHVEPITMHVKINYCIFQLS